MVPPGRENQGEACSSYEVMIEEAPGHVFEVLSSPCRRCLLHYFRVRDTDTAVLDEIYRFVHSETTLEFSEEEFRVQLHHQHLPLLEDGEVLEYDERDEMIRYFGDPLIETCLKLVSEYDLN